AAERRQIQKRPCAAERFDATIRREVRAIHALAVAEEYADPEGLCSVGRDTKVDVEITASGGKPRHRPPHALLVSPDVCQGGARDEHKRRIARMQMREVSDLVDKEGAPIAAGGGPTIDR